MGRRFAPQPIQRTHGAAVAHLLVYVEDERQRFGRRQTRFMIGFASLSLQASALEESAWRLANRFKTARVAPAALE